MGSILSMQWPVSEKRQRPTPGGLLVIAGAMHQIRGRISVLRGTLLHNDIMRANGYRQQLVGMLQRFWKRDRKSVELWLDALLRRTPPAPAPRKVLRARPPIILHQES